MKLHQHFTPTWAAELLVRRFFPDLNAKDTVVEPACGDGRFLLAIPSHVDAFGVEIDPSVAELARMNSGRDIITGDFCQVDLPRRPTAVIGNPPFDLDLFDAMLSRCHDLLEYGGRCGFLLPVYTFQTASRVVNYNRRWSLSQELLPRNLFEGLSAPIMWATFSKDRQTAVSGLFLHAELDALTSMHPELRKLMVGNASTATCWRDVVHRALEALGGHGSLQEIYRVVESNRPSKTQWWREKVRQIAARHFTRLDAGVYALKRHQVQALFAS